MIDNVQLANRLSIREAGFNEYWLQDRIWKHPACLGLGELEPLEKERQQHGGGRLDILLKSPVDETMFEVEVMLDATDESHIIRTIEYWDNEKRRWPQRQHKAVLVAEHINRRFFNVIHLLSSAIPIVAIQVALIETSGQRSLFFTKVLDTYQEVDDGASTQQHTHSSDEIINYITDPSVRKDFDKVLIDLTAMGVQKQLWQGGRDRCFEFTYDGEEVFYLSTLKKGFKSQHFDPEVDGWIKSIPMATHAEWEQRSKPFVKRKIEELSRR